MARPSTVFASLQADGSLLIRRENQSTPPNVFLKALDGIRRSALACNYDIPAPKSGDIDYRAVNVTFSEGGSRPETFFYVASADDCDLSAAHAWYYDDPNAPKQVVLCPQTCQLVSAASDGNMDVTFGCKRNDVVR